MGKDTTTDGLSKAGRTHSGIGVYPGVFGRNEMLHLLKRTLFGIRKTDADHFRNKSLQEVVDELLHPPAFMHPPPVNDYDEIGSYKVPYGATWINSPYDKEDDDGLRIQSFRKWSMGVLINQDRSLREKMTLFWHNHFATQTNIGRSNMIWNHFSLLRENALGNFKKLTRQITIDCHMLRYLNGEENTMAAPNENYARELQELFCIGKGEEAKFTESDVRQAAKVLTGWKVNMDTNTSYFKPSEHDTTDKVFSAFYKHTVIKGRDGAGGGEQELDELLDMIFANRETALFICRKLYRWFVYYSIDDETEKKCIAPLAEILIAGNYEIKPVLRALLTSEHFFDKKNYAAQLKSPFDFCIGLHREFSIPVSVKEKYAVNYSMLGLLIDQCLLMGQVYGDPPNVSGWPAYYQAPGFYTLWINTSTYPRRNEFSATMIDYGYNREGAVFAVDVVEFARSLSNPGDADSLINESLELLYRIPVSMESRNALKQNTLLSGQTGDHYWADAWRDYVNNPSNQVARNVIETRLKNMYRFIVSSPEYQLA